HINRTGSSVRVRIQHRMLRLFTPGAQQAPAAAGDWDCILYIRDYAIGIQFQIPSHLPVADDLKMINGNNGTQRGGELHLVIAGRQAKFIAQLAAAERESEQWAVGRKGAALFQ